MPNVSNLCVRIAVCSLLSSCASPRSSTAATVRACPHCIACVADTRLRAADYTKMINLKDADTGKHVFESIAITLVCDKCLKTDRTFTTHTLATDCSNARLPLCTDPERCTHKMSEVPRWISSKKVEIVRTLLSEDPAMLYAHRQRSNRRVCAYNTHYSRMCTVCARPSASRPTGPKSSSAATTSTPSWRATTSRSCGSTATTDSTSCTCSLQSTLRAAGPPRSPSAR